MKLTVNIWRQHSPTSPGNFEQYSRSDFEPAMSIPEMLDHLNLHLMREGKRPISFESDCREGICGQCGFMINGEAHGPEKGTTACQTHLRSFKDGDTLWLEPFRAKAFPLKQDLMIDRSAFDDIIASGGFISVDTGPAPEANSILIAHQTAEDAFDAAACIGCGACVAACPNASASLFTAAKISHLAYLPQGKIEENDRVLRMVEAMDLKGFGACSLIGACEAVCPQGISLDNIAKMNGAYRKANWGF